MKIDITFKDASEAEVIALLNKLNETPAQLSLPLAAPQKVAETDDNEGHDTIDPTLTLDKRGLPWDERIHSSNRAQTADGLWRRRRGVSAELIEQVEAELFSGKQNVAAAQAPVPTLAEFPTVAVATVPEVTVPHFLQPAAPATSQYSFANMMTTISNLYSSGLADPTYVGTITSRLTQAFNVQVNALTDIMQNQQMIEYVFALMKNDGKIA